VAGDTWLVPAVYWTRQKCPHIFGTIMSKISTNTSENISAHLTGSFSIMFSNIFLTLSVMAAVASNDAKSALRMESTKPPGWLVQTSNYPIPHFVFSYR
jgi:hypothetical protein